MVIASTGTPLLGSRGDGGRVEHRGEENDLRVDVGHSLNQFGMVEDAILPESRCELVNEVHDPHRSMDQRHPHLDLHLCGGGHGRSPRPLDNPLPVGPLDEVVHPLRYHLEASKGADIVSFALYPITDYGGHDLREGM